MSNQRSVMTEFRFLDQKRQTEGLTADEAQRYAQLRELVGAETAGPARSGFDVNAAAARLRESLLPAGLRHPPVEAAAPPPAPEPAPLPAPGAAALAQAWAAAPFAPLTAEPAEPFFDPGALATEVLPQAWNPEAPGYDPEAPYDEAAWIAAGYDPNVTYDWAAAGYGPDGQPLAAGAAEVEVPIAEAEAPASLDAEPDLGPAAGDAPAPAGESSPEPLLTDWAPPSEELPFDPNAPFDHAKWFGRAGPSPRPAAAPEPEPAREPAPEPAPALAEPLLDDGPEPVLDFDLTAEETAPEPLAFGEYDESAVTPPGPELEPLEAEGFVAPAVAEPLPPEPAPAAEDLDAAWFDDVGPAPHDPAPAGAPLGEYDEAGAGAAAGLLGAEFEALLPFDPAAASAVEQGGMPEGYEPGGPALDPATLPAMEAGGYEDPAAFPADQASGDPDGGQLPGGPPLELDAAVPDWQPETALEQGFALASDGSFGHADPPPAPPAPAWGGAGVPAGGWESAPALDLAGPFEPPALTPAEPLEAWAPPVPTLAEELPTIEGAELLEELPPEPASPLDLSEPSEPELSSPLDGAFDQAEAVEEAADPPPDLAADFAAAGSEPPIAEAALLEPEASTAEAPSAEPALLEFEPQFEPEPEPEPAPAPAWAQPLPEPSPEVVALPAALHGAAVPPEIAAAYGDAGPSSDTFELPPALTDGLFDAEGGPEPLEAEPLPPPAPAVLVEGSHRVVLHTVDGQVRRGLLVDALLDALELPLQPQGAGAAEAIPTDLIKAIFFMLTPGERAPVAEGKRVRVTFRDGRQVAGFSPDYQDGAVGFFMIPADTRTNTGRIWVYQAAVKHVTVS